MSNTSIAEELRHKLKQAGYNARKVTIRHELYSMGSTVHATIRSADVDPFQVQQILEGAERVSRCELTGEILSGGNRYVDLHYSDEVKEILSRRHHDAYEAARDQLDTVEPGTFIKIHGTGLMLGRPRDRKWAMVVCDSDNLVRREFNDHREYKNCARSVISFMHELALLEMRRKREAERLAAVPA